RLSLAIRAAGTAVGAVELRPDGDAVYVSYLVAPDRRGRNIAARALAALLDWAEYKRAYLECHIDNLASQRVAERCGFTLVGRAGDELRYERSLIKPASQDSIPHAST
ncbi:MAG TPA: GNAT family protein, partial [Gaiellaceae bacterium]|nr:GNAT family protein [Gaiellaceae bacterium]